MSKIQRSRFRDGTGQRPSLKAVLNAPIALYQTIIRKLVKRHPKLPWIPFAVINKLNSLIDSDWTVLEIGAGMSTLWYAERCKQVISIEADKKWFDILSNVLHHEGRTNVDLRYEWMGERMSNFSEHLDASLDLVIVDGGPREACTSNALVKVKPGGYIYLDNSDSTELCGDAVNLLLRWVNYDKSYYSFYTDFVPGNFFVTQGLLVQRPIV